MKCDVLVIGAGPAGSTLAHQLARQGFEVRLADRKAFPRHKACGEFLSPQCLPYLQDLGVEAEVRAMGPMLVRGMHLNGYGQAATGRFRQLPAATTPQLAGFGIRRERFDELLRAASERAFHALCGAAARSEPAGEGLARGALDRTRAAPGGGWPHMCAAGGNPA